MTREDIARTIRESRLATGLTQSQVAKELGRPQQTIANWESGKSQPDANTLFDLFRVLGRSVDEAFGFTKEAPPLSGEAIKIAWDYDRMDRHGKAVARSVITGELERMENTPIYLHYYNTKVPADVDIRNRGDAKLLIVKCNNLTSEADFCVSLSDDLPEWNYWTGNTILVKRCPNVKLGELSLFVMNGETIVGTQSGQTIRFANSDRSVVRAFNLQTQKYSGECLGTVLGKLEQEWVLEEWSTTK